MNLVDEEDDATVGVGHLLDDALQSLLELAFVLGSGYECAHVERVWKRKRSSWIWGDSIVIDWKEEAEKTYGFQVDVLRRGRGSWILETDQGLRLLKEYRRSLQVPMRSMNCMRMFQSF